MRSCINFLLGRGGEKCKGDYMKIKSCNGFDCGVSWMVWLEWSECSKICFLGIEVRIWLC